MKSIRVTIDPVGRPKVEAIGFQGVGCKDATKAIEDALGGGGENITEFKPEYNENEGDNELTL